MQAIALKSSPSIELLALMATAEAAGRVLMGHYDQGLRTGTRKQDGTVVSAADLASDLSIRAGLKSFSPYPVVSEEQDASLAVQNGKTPYWLVDPLDGTLAFLEGNGEFAICIALMNNHRPVMGVIHSPTSQESFAAETAVGAFCQKAGQPWAPIIPTGEDTAARTVVRSRHHHNPVTEAFVQMNQVRSCIAMGSALKFVRVACGDASVYPNFDGSGEWDTAAGQVLLETLGGSVIDVNTHQPLRYGKPRLRNPFFVAFGPSTAYQDWRIPKL